MELAESDPRARLIIEAVHTGDHSRLADLLEPLGGPAVVRLRDEHGTLKTLLHCATDWPGHFPGGGAMIGWLAEQGVPIDAPAVGKSEARETALHWAASADDLRAIDALLLAGADLEAPGAVFTNGTPLSDAIVFRKRDAAERLVAAGAATEPWHAAALGLHDILRASLMDLTGDQRNVAVWHACRYGELTAVQLLVDAGADLDWVGPMDRTPRQAAADAEDQALDSWLAAH